MLDKPGTISLDLECRAGLAPREALRRCREALRVGDMGARVAAFYVADIADRHAYLELGCSSLKQLNETQLRLKESTLDEYARTGRALNTLPVIDEALADDRLSWTHARILARVATPETERVWAEWATTRSTRQLQRQVTPREKGDLPTDPEKRRIHTVKQDVGCKLNPTQYERWRRARAKLEAETGRVVSDADMMMEAARLLLETRPDGSVPGRTPVNDSHYQLHAHCCQRCLVVTTDAEDGGEQVLDIAELSRPQLARVQPSEPSDEDAFGSEGAEKEELEPGPSLLDPDNEGLTVLPEERAQPTSETLRREVLIRDRFRCLSCGSKRGLTVHHKHWRRYGGPTVAGNLMTLCEGCHSLVHARLLIVQGEVPNELIFLNREGQSIDHSALCQPVTVTRVPANEEAGGGGSLLEFNELPAEVDTAWWRRHLHLFAWSERRGELVFSPGIARESHEAPEMPQTSDEVDSIPGNTLESLHGQPRARDRLAVSIEAGRIRGEPLRHLLLTGPPGVGKTYLAEAIANELSRPIVPLPGPVVRSPDVLLRTLTCLAPGSLLFLDEIHSLPPRVVEVLYEALDKGVLNLSVRQGLEQRSLKIRLAPFTLVGATTDDDRLPKPLLSRLSCERLEFYTTDELEEIIDQAASVEGLELAPDARARLAGASRETPRQGLILLEAVRDEAIVSGRRDVDLELVVRAMGRLEIDPDGLTALDHAYLEALAAAGRPLGVRSLAATLGARKAVIERVCEPFLLRRRMIRITPLGRVLNERSRPNRRAG